MSQRTQAGSRLGAIILAAGDSRRMGQPKALLSIGGETFLGRWLRLLAEARIATVRVVLGRDAATIRAQVELPDRQVVLQPHPEEGMLSSLRLGMGSLPEGLGGLFLCPVDHPQVGADLIPSLAAALRPGVVVVPVHGGRRGHPVLFSADLFAELRTVPLASGARAVVRADPGRVVEVPAAAGVLVDIDTPAEYDSLSQD
ncbi:MAG: nucleotidyltransferase family protein [Acidobacteria bacterium]|nr:nucleotidyltransferase family protein [Acidobacteriota bacterium]